MSTNQVFFSYEMGPTIALMCSVVGCMHIRRRKYLKVTSSFRRQGCLGIHQTHRKNTWTCCKICYLNCSCSGFENVCGLQGIEGGICSDVQPWWMFSSTVQAASNMEVSGTTSIYIAMCHLFQQFVGAF